MAASGKSLCCIQTLLLAFYSPLYEALFPKNSPSNICDELSRSYFSPKEFSSIIHLTCIIVLFCQATSPMFLILKRTLKGLIHDCHFQSQPRSGARLRLRLKIAVVYMGLLKRIDCINYIFQPNVFSFAYANLLNF